MTFTDKSYKALRRDTEGKHNVVTDMLDEIDKLRAEIARRDEIITRLKEDGERLAARPYPFTDVGHIESGTYCHYCHKSNKFDHAPDCPITLHRALMKELE